jgi:hypothetical protein
VKLFSFAVATGSTPRKYMVPPCAPRRSTVLTNLPGEEVPALKLTARSLHH